MKCYIATYYQYDNYGTRLQNFALCYTIKRLGHEPITLSITNKKENIIKDIFSYLPKVTKKQRLWLNNRKKRKIFKDFNRNLNFKNITYNELYKIDFSNAIAIAGSDQVWSPNHLMKKKREKELYFLKFAPKNKRFAYAPSFGVSQLSEEIKDLYKENLKEFKSLSVREVAGQKIILDLIDETVPIIPDPVFLMSKNDWKTITSNVNKNRDEKEYILTYFLGEPNEKIKNRIEKYAKDNKYKIISIAGNSIKENDIIPAPDEFIELIENAKVVFTDSFHASAFSIIMTTPFFVFKREDVKQFSRIETLLKKYNCLDSIVDNIEIFSNSSDIILNRNTILIDEEIEKEREKGLNYLEDIIHEKGNN